MNQRAHKPRLGVGPDRHDQIYVYLTQALASLYRATEHASPGAELHGLSELAEHLKNQMQKYEPTQTGESCRHPKTST